RPPNMPILHPLPTFHSLFHHHINTTNTEFALSSLLTFCTKQPLHPLFASQLHARIILTGHQHNRFLNTKLVHLYSKCNMLLHANTVFHTIQHHDHVSWTSIIAAFAQNGRPTQALLLPNCFTFATVITASTHLEQTASFHAHVVHLGCHSNQYVVSSLIDSYSKSGKLNHSILIYNQTLHRDVVLLNSMIAAYSQNLRGEEAFQLFVQMHTTGQCPTDHTYSSILNSCATLTALQQGRQVHSLITKIGSDTNVFVASSLVDMYSKCGNIDEARRIFDQLPHRNSILWTSMITGYAHCGRGADGLELFEQLVKEQGMTPDNICFTAVLTACNHAGFVDRATEYFNKMGMEYGLTPQLDQYACMVDLYGKTGQLIKAKKMLEDMPFEPNAVMWSSFLGSCKVYAQVDLGREAANHLFKMDPYNAAPYVTMANIYAEAGMWEEVLQVRKLMRENGVKKTAGWSWIEVDKGVHVFSVSDTSHPRLQDIYVELNKLTLEMMEAGYMHVMKYVSEDNTNECILLKLVYTGFYLPSASFILATIPKNVIKVIFVLK
ncbi:hypothetical protein AQUCO_01400023v1, partial [Aquilegia coerulea]